MISAEKIPNNVNLSDNKRLLRALEHWQPKYLQWWRDMGPQGFQDYHQVYVRTATSVDPEGWAHFEFVKLPEYRWGIFLAEPTADRRIGFGDFFGRPVWQEVPGEFRNQLRRLIVTQGDTEPARGAARKLGPPAFALRPTHLFQSTSKRPAPVAMSTCCTYLAATDARRPRRAQRSAETRPARIIDAFNEPMALARFLCSRCSRPRR